MNTVTTSWRRSNPQVGLHSATPTTAGSRHVDQQRSGRTARLGRRLFSGPSTDPRWARPALLALLAATAIAYTWNLTASGWANAFYSAAAQAGSQNWEAFFFGSSDAANSITVDKPPASLWVMGLSVRLFGLNSFAILFPQVLMGVATVGTLYAAVKRYFHAAAGLLSAAVLALTPVAVLMFRFNNPDALLVLLMTAAAWATMRAVERGSIRWMALVGTLLGFAFLTKTFQAFLVVPFFGLAYLVCAAAPLRRRLVGSAVAAAAMAVSGGWWVLIVEVTPASMRPYIGGSQNNSFWDLTFGYNGFGRLSGSETGSVGGGGGAGSGQWGQTGLTRMFNSEIGGQISWFLPAAILLTIVGVVLRGRSPRVDLRRASYLVWGGWLLVTTLTFSLMAGIFHAYYTVALAPAIAALVGMGAYGAWQARSRAIGSIALGAATATTATWSFILLSRTGEYGDWLRIGVLAVGMAAAFMLLALPWLHTSIMRGVVVAAVVASLAGPAAYSMTTLTTSHQGSIVTAGPNNGGMGGGGAAPGHTASAGTKPAGGMSAGPGKAPGSTSIGNRTPAQRGQVGGKTQSVQAGGNIGGIGGLLNATTPNTQVVTALSAKAKNFTWVAAAVGSQNAAGLQLGTGLPVMAIGGFNGSDPSPTLGQFQSYAKAGKVHYVLASETGSGGSGSSGSAAQILNWVKTHYKTVTIGGQTFYDLTQAR